MRLFFDISSAWVALMYISGCGLRQRSIRRIAFSLFLFLISFDILGAWAARKMYISDCGLRQRSIGRIRAGLAMFFFMELFDISFSELCHVVDLRFALSNLSGGMASA